MDSANDFQNIESTNFAASYTQFYGYPDEWYQRSLPHRNKIGLIQFITFRLADSLPQNLLEEIKYEIDLHKGSNKQTELRKKYQHWLDQGLGCCALSKREMAETVQETLFLHDGMKYDLICWSIMPNHIHTLIKTKDALGKIVQSWKSFTGRWGLNNNERLSLGIERGARRFWMSDYWDRFIRNEDHFNNTIRYILNYPAKAGLPKKHIAYEYRGLKLGLEPKDLSI